MNNTDIIEHFIKTQIPVSEQKIFSKLPGIYAFFFTGKDFPIEGFILPKHKIVYIGKTESSQQSRDANTHFKSGKTGSSTVRKSVGALLSQSEEIVSVIRSLSDVEKRRKIHYKFDDKSEEKVTKWMIDNLAVSFYEFPESKEKINSVETELIKLVQPVLNIDAKNPENEHKSLIQHYRKKLGILAHISFITDNDLLGKKRVESIPTVNKMINLYTVGSAKYQKIWNAYLEEIKSALSNGILINKIQLDEELFHQVGNRKNYNFRLEFQNGKVSNNISGSAVARDLRSVLTKEKITIDNKVFKMSKEFELIICDF